MFFNKQVFFHLNINIILIKLQNYIFLNKKWNNQIKNIKHNLIINYNLEYLNKMNNELYIKKINQKLPYSLSYGFIFGIYFKRGRNRLF